MPSRRHRPNNAAKLAKRRAQRARRRDREARERAAELAAIGADLVRIRDPDPEEAAVAFERVFGSAPPPPAWTEELFDELGADRSRTLAAAALRRVRSPGALALTADVALLLDGDAPAAERHVDEALRQQDDSFLGVRKARALADQGKLAQAAEAMGPVLADLPDLEEPQLHRGRWLAALAKLQRTPASACPCGSGETFEACCASAARALMAAFHDRQPLYDLHHAVYAHVGSSDDLERAVLDGIDEWVDLGAAARGEMDGWMAEAAGDEGHGALPLAIERAWSLPLLERDRSVLDEFCDDPSTPPDLAGRAEQWREWVAWGLWQVTGVGDPGVVVTNVVTGTQLYAAIPQELRDGLLPWVVLAGYFVPVDGVWRAGSTFYQASPEESRPLAELVLDAAAYLARKTSNPGLGGWVHSRSEDLGRGWYLPGDEAAPPDLARTIGVVCGSVFPRLVAHLRRTRARLPQTVNTDGEPMEWIEAEPGDPTPHAPEADEAWLRSLPDESLPALDGLTPREAAHSPEHRGRLELFAREMEYRLASRGSSITGAVLRERLGLS